MQQLSVTTIVLGYKEDTPMRLGRPLVPLELTTEEQTLLESWIAIRNVKLAPPQTKALYRGLTLLAEAPVEQRTITNLITSSTYSQTIRNF